MDEVDARSKSTTISSSKLFSEQELFEILSHPLRRQILRYLYQYYVITYSELRGHIGSSPGVIYHHLQKIEKLQLICQNDKKEYKLTEKGNQIVNYMNQSADQSTPLTTAARYFSSLFHNTGD